jgi:histidyl-tRNA synthetase
MFKKSGQQVPCVGISFGVDRIFGITKSRIEAEAAAKEATATLRTNDVDVFVMAFGGDGCLKPRMEILNELWTAGISAEISWKKKPKLPQQFKAAEVAAIPLAVIVGEDELAKGQVKIKVMGAAAGDPEKDGVLVERTQLVEEVRKRIPESTLASKLGALNIKA